MASEHVLMHLCFASSWNTVALRYKTVKRQEEAKASLPTLPMPPTLLIKPFHNALFPHGNIKAAGNSPSSIHDNILRVSGRPWRVNTPREALGGALRTENYWVLVLGSPSSATLPPPFIPRRRLSATRSTLRPFRPHLQFTPLPPLLLFHLCG